MNTRSRRNPASRRATFEALEGLVMLTLPAAAPPLGPPPPPSASVIWVNTEAALQSAVGNRQSRQTIVIQKGTYNLSNTLYVGKSRQVTGVTIRGETDNYGDVVLLGKVIFNGILIS